MSDQSFISPVLSPTRRIRDKKIAPPGNWMDGLHRRSRRSFRRMKKVTKYSQDGNSRGNQLKSIADLPLPAHVCILRAVPLYRPDPFPSDRHRVEYLFALYEKITAPLVAAAKPKRKRG
jgi:hypothetical protein